MDKLITIEEVREAYERRPNSKLSDLVEEMELLGQSKVREETYLLALNTPTCGKCGEEVREGVSYCPDCRREIEYERKRKELVKNFKNLTNELNKVAGKERLYVLLECKRTGEIYIKRDSGEDYAEIYRKTMYSGGWHSNDKALKVRTSDWSIENNRLRRDFGAKGLAESLHKACNKCLGDIKDTREAANRKAKANKDLTDDLTKRFPGAVISNVEGNSAKLSFGSVRVDLYKREDGAVVVRRVEAYKKVGNEDLKTIVGILNKE